MVEFKKFSKKTKKDNIRVLIYIAEFKVFGTVHLPMGGRLTDFLNTKGLGSEGEIFIPITDASIYNVSDGAFLHYSPFLNVNKEMILFIFPQETLCEGEKGEPLDTKNKIT